MTTVAAIPARPPLPAALPAGGSTATSPPLALPGEHFAVALIYFVIGALGLVFIAPDLARGAFFLPRVAAVVHLFTLGWIMLSIFGALCQFLPVAIDRTIRWQRLAHVTFALEATGVAVFTVALVTSTEHGLHAGAVLVGTAFLLGAINLVATLAGATTRSLTWWALAGASLFLAITPIFGVVLAINLHANVLGAARFATIARHVHVAIGGVVLLVMVGVAHKLLPMFLLAHGVGTRWARAAVVLLFIGALVLALPIGGMIGMRAGATLLGGGLLAFLLQALSYYRHRIRRHIDPGMRLVAAGLVGLAATLVAAPFALAAGLANPRLLVIYHLLLIGAVSLFVAGHYYKIVPFLIWYHRFGPLVGLRPVPRVHELYSGAVASVVVALLVAGWIGLVAGVALASPGVVRASALVFAAGAVVEAVAVASIARRRPA